MAIRPRSMTHQCLSPRPRTPSARCRRNDAATMAVAGHTPARVGTPRRPVRTKRRREPRPEPARLTDDDRPATDGATAGREYLRRGGAPRTPAATAGCSPSLLNQPSTARPTCWAPHQRPRGRSGRPGLTTQHDGSRIYRLDISGCRVLLTYSHRVLAYGPAEQDAPTHAEPGGEKNESTFRPAGAGHPRTAKRVSSAWLRAA